MFGGKRSYHDNAAAASSAAVENHELTALKGHEHPDDIDAGDDDDNAQGLDEEEGEGEEGERALLGHESKSKSLVRSEETTWQFIYNILIETAPTLLLSTTGLTFSGEVVQRVANWQAIKRVDELYILIPMLNNLKGNLEMNLSSRLSTAANIGELDDVITRRSLVLGNLMLIQVQALMISAVAAILSFLLGLVLSSGGNGGGESNTQSRHKSGFKEFMVLLTSSMTSASMSSIILGSFMCTLVLICRRYSRNPDNITPPIASCLGDLLTLCIIGLISALLVRAIDTLWPIPLLIALISCGALATYFSLRNEHARPLVSQGWIPLLAAMAISAGAGMVLDEFVSQFEGFGLLSIVIGGLPGSVGSVLVSRLSTALHAAALHPPSTNTPSRTTTLTLTLFGITLPVLFIFLAFIQLLGWTHLPLLFFVILVPTFCITVISSLFIARILTHLLWSRNLDPDTYAMPIQSSLVDLVGQLMLVICFTVARLLGAKVQS